MRATPIRSVLRATGARRRATPIRPALRATGTRVRALAGRRGTGTAGGAGLGVLFKRRRIRTGVLAAVVALSPTTATVLAPAAANRPAAPIGTAVWRADPRALPDPVTADPAAVRRFYATEPPAARRALALRYPGVVGASDGAPVALRYAANRVAMRAAGPRFADRPGRYLLFDPRGDGRAAEVFGDLARADRIAVLVPGAGVGAANFWSGVGGRGYRALARQADQLYRSARRPGFAVIAWLGYTTPKGVSLSEAREDLARTGAAALVRFVAGLAAVRPHATVALLAHSYGSVVVGLAARRLPPQVTDLVVVGSPGMGVDDVSRLGTAARVWAGRCPGDWIRWVPGERVFGLGHGRAPTDPAFGARAFGTGGVADHDHYFAPGTASLANLAAIATRGALR
ncbi:alpha/beta hydrolase [Actinocatenispora sera]|uniref:alpha/beta hydrolase n=1 Tax=Actinocatenispora sera TaxID=390989 RepID=UPI0034056B01